MSSTQSTLYVYGKATYSDTISSSETHYLEFCTKLSGLTYVSGFLNPGAFAFNSECGRHNCSDEECDLQKTAPQLPHSTSPRRTPR